MNNSTTDLIQFLNTLPPEDLLKFYEHSSIIILIIKTLSKDTTKIIFDLLWNNISFSGKQLQIKNHLKILKNLRFIEKKEDRIKLIDSIKINLINEFNKLEESNEFMLCKCKKYESKVEDDLISQFSSVVTSHLCKITENKNKLEDILHNIVDPHHFNPLVKKILGKKNLLDGNNKITYKGFEFLLKSKKEQTWFFLLEGILFLKSEDQIKLFLCLSKLSRLKNGVLYEFTTNMINELKFFNDIGILELKNGNHFYLNESFSNLFMFKIPPAKKFLIIETNHKIYAYTNSAYDKSILTQFCEIHSELPSVTVCSLSLENINKAFERGITGEQIVNYLENYSNNVPQAIKELIFVYEKQKNRIRINEGYLYKNFLNIVDYEKTVKFCAENGFLLGKDPQARVLIVKNEAHSYVKEFVKRNI